MSTLEHFFKECHCEGSLMFDDFKTYTPKGPPSGVVYRMRLKSTGEVLATAEYRNEGQLSERELLKQGRSAFLDECRKQGVTIFDD